MAVAKPVPKPAPKPAPKPVVAAKPAPKPVVKAAPKPAPKPVAPKVQAKTGKAPVPIAAKAISKPKVLPARPAPKQGPVEKIAAVRAFAPPPGVTASSVNLMRARANQARSADIASHLAGRPDMAGDYSNVTRTIPVAQQTMVGSKALLPGSATPYVPPPPRPVVNQQARQNAFGSLFGGSAPHEGKGIQSFGQFASLFGRPAQNAGVTKSSNPFGGFGFGNSYKGGHSR